MVGIGTLVAGEGGSGEISRRGREFVDRGGQAYCLVTLEEGEASGEPWYLVWKLSAETTKSWMWSQWPSDSELPWLGGKSSPKRRLLHNKLREPIESGSFVPNHPTHSLEHIEKARRKRLPSTRWAVIHGVVVAEDGDVIRRRDASRCVVQMQRLAPNQATRAASGSLEYPKGSQLQPACISAASSAQQHQHPPTTSTNLATNHPHPLINTSTPPK